MKTDAPSDNAIIEFLEKDPSLRDIVAEMMEIAAGPEKLDVSFDDAEDIVVGHIRRTGKKLLQKWAQTASDKATKEALSRGEGRSHEKKLVNHTSVGETVVEEQGLLRKSGGESHRVRAWL